MAVLIHERADGELVVSECEWPEGVQSFNRILEEYYGDSPKSVWEIAEREERGVLSAVGVAGDAVVLSSHRLLLRPDGITVVPEEGVPWLLVRRDGSPPARVSHRRPREQRLAWHTLTAVVEHGEVNSPFVRPEGTEQSLPPA